MNLYSHYYLAMQLAGITRPEDPAEYAWGAIAADMRYVARMRREQTHRPMAEIDGWLEEFPALHSFALGYRVHCLLDQIDVAATLGQTFPLSLARLARRKGLPRRPAVMLVEVYFTRQPDPALCPPISGSYNAILERLGASREDCATYAEVAREYLDRRKQASVLDNITRMASRSGMLDDDRIAGYIGAARKVLDNRAALLPLLWCVKRARFERRAEALVA